MADRALTGILLVGGTSRRFGSAKAVAELGGETFAERAWRLLGDACAERIAVGTPGVPLPFPTLADAGTGPVDAIRVGLAAAVHDIAVVIPVDMPLLTVDALHALADACRDAAVGPRGPLPCALRTALAPAFATDERRLRFVLDALDTAAVRLPDAVLENVNEPQDLRRL